MGRISFQCQEMVAVMELVVVREACSESAGVLRRLEQSLGKMTQVADYYWAGVMRWVMALLEWTGQGKWYWEVTIGW